MTAHVNHNGDAPTEIEALLPWHAAGTLNARDARRVEDALARDPQLARQYAVIRDELGEAIHLNENLGAPSSRALGKLMAAIDAEPARKAQGSVNLGGRIVEFFASLSPRTLAYSASAAALALLLQAGIIGAIVMKQQAPGAYQTASYREKAAVQPLSPAAAVTGAFVLVGFAPDARAGDIAAFLDQKRAIIVDGPKAGLFRIRLSDRPLTKDELEQRLGQMSGDKLISFVAPAD